MTIFYYTYITFCNKYALFAAFRRYPVRVDDERPILNFNYVFLPVVWMYTYEYE